MRYDYLVVGAGIIGMTIAKELLIRDSQASILIIDKENKEAMHASGRNSGVLHAGFYYSEDSLKAKFTVEGNKRMKEFCSLNNIKVNASRKVVVAKNSEELQLIYELDKRAVANGVEVEIIDEEELEKMNPNAKTYKKALYSPNTASVNPKEVCAVLKSLLQSKGVQFLFDTNFNDCNIKYSYLINASGAYADKIAKKFGLAHEYTMLPFKGIYLKYMENKTDVKTNIYPVPNLANPFLGVHYTITADGSIKIGPTAIPAFWRENYSGFSGFNLKEMIEILYYESILFIRNSFNFRTLALAEIKNYNRRVFVQKAVDMVKSIGVNFQPIPAGIRAQLLNVQTRELVQDFVIEHGQDSTHILNAVSPAFTCSFAFAEHVVDEIYENKRKS